MSNFLGPLYKPPFLLVLLQAESANTFSSFVLNGLKDTLEQHKLDYLLGKTFYKAAIEHIELWEQTRHDNIERLEQVLIEDYNGRTVTGLKKDLAGPRGDAALAIFGQAVEKAIGLPFSPTAVFQRPFEAFEDITQKLIETNRYSGVVVIADEFTSLLAKLAESVAAADSKAIDNLAESAVRSSQRQLHFYVVSLESFSSIATTSKASKEALERTGGRFKEFSLTAQNSEELISMAIGKLIRPELLFNGAQGQLDDLLNISMQLWNSRVTGKKERDWLRQTVVQGCFPLHPLATFCLSELNRRLAQNNRTMFSFLWDETHGLHGFINCTIGEPNNGWFTLFTLDMLYDYFATNLHEKRPELELAYSDACRKLTPVQVEGLEGRMLRALLMLEIANQRADRDLLRHAVGLPSTRLGEVAQSIEELVQTGVIYPSQAGFYHLVKRGGVDPLQLRRLIERQAQEIKRSPIETLNAQFAPHAVEATNYNSEHNTVRNLTARYIHPAELSSPATLEQNLQGNEGLLWYVVASTEQEVEQAHTMALQLTRQHPQLVIAVPRHPSDLLLRLRRKLALETVRIATEYQTAAYQDLLNNNGLLGREYNDDFETARRAFEQPSTFDWFQGGHTVLATMQAHLNNIATTVMQAVFPATPRHGTRQHLKPSGKSKDLSNAIDKILQAPFRLPVGRGRKNAEEAILLDGAGELGYIRHEKLEQGYAEYNVCSPDSQFRDSRKIWLLVEDELRKGASWAGIQAMLVAPPYGLYLSVLQLFLAAFYRYNQDYLEIYPISRISVQPVDVTADVISKIIETPTAYIFRYQPLHEVQARFLRKLVERALYNGRPLQLSRGETASLRNNTAKYLRVWVEKLPVSVHYATIEQLAVLYPNTPESVLKVGITLLKIATLPQEAATAAALLDELPKQLRLPDDCAVWTDDAIDLAIANLESVCQQLLRFDKVFKSQMAWRIGELFDIVEPPKNWDDTLKAALAWRKNIANLRGHHLVGAPDSRDLLAGLDDTPHSFVQLFLNVLPQRWQLGLFEQWKTISTCEGYLRRLQQAKAIVDAKAAEIGVTLPETKPSVGPAVLPPPALPRQVEPSEPDSTGASSSMPIPTPNHTLPSVVTPEKDKTEAINLILPDPSSKKTSSPDGVAIVGTSALPQKQTLSIDEAENKIVEIFEQVARKDQYVLWDRLKARYD